MADGFGIINDMWRLWAIIGFAVWILIISIALNPGTTRTLLTQLSALAIVVLALWRLSADHVHMTTAQSAPEVVTQTETKSAIAEAAPSDIQA